MFLSRGTHTRDQWRNPAVSSTAVALLLLAFALQVTLGHASGSGLLDSGFCAVLVQPLSSYNCTEYLISTSDGYKLTVQHIVRSNLTEVGDAILFLHSAILGGEFWFSSPSPTPLSAANRGYSVWIANFRASRFSLGHQNFKEDQKDYWNFCNDEISNYDFPAFLQFVYAKNANRSLHIVGYSQGASVAIGAMSYQRITGLRLKSVILLAPVVYMRHVISPILKAIGASDLGLIGYNRGARRFPLSLFGNSLWPQASMNTTLTKKLAIASVTGPNCCIDVGKAYELVTGPYSYIPYKSIAHLAQNIHFGTYAAFDYLNVDANRNIYHDAIPPTYRFNNVPSNIPILVVYGGNDQLTSPKDIKNLTRLLPTPPQKLLLHSYAHLDMILSRTIETDINQPILQFIEDHSKGI